MAYLGNRSRELQNSAGGAGSNINLVPAGAMFSATNPGNANANLYRPLQGYGDLNLATNNLYSNYNACKWHGRVTAAFIQFRRNYTWQKALGIVLPTVNPFNLARQLRRSAYRSAESFQRCIFDRSREPRPCESIRERSPERLAVLGHHAGAERRELSHMAALTTSTPTTTCH